MTNVAQYLMRFPDKTEDDDEKRREYEGIELERDDHLVTIEDEALTAKQQAQEASHTLSETQRKLQVQYHNRSLPH